jgi:hypothetical protein
LLPEHLRPLPEHAAVATKRGHNAGEQPEERKIIFLLLVFLFCVGCHTQSIVEIHERSVLRRSELRRDESEASGDEKRKSDHLSKL